MATTNCGLSLLMAMLCTSFNSSWPYSQISFPLALRKQNVCCCLINCNFTWACQVADKHICTKKHHSGKKLWPGHLLHSKASHWNRNKSYWASRFQFSNAYELSILAVLGEVTGLILSHYSIIAANLCRVNAINRFLVGSKMEREFRLRTINLMYYTVNILQLWNISLY